MICKQCHQEKTHYARGLCLHCYSSVRSKERRAVKIDCPECGEHRTNGSLGLCEACYAKLRRDRNPDVFHERDKARWGKRREKENQRRKSNYQKNKTHHLELSHQYHREYYNEIRQQQSEYRTQHAEHIRDRNRLYNATKRDHAKELARLKEWTAQQPREKLRALWVVQVQRRTAKIKALPHTLTRQEWEHIKQKFDNCCAYCGQSFSHLTQDHVIPISRGGGYTAANIVPACRSCNSRKGTRTAQEFIDFIKSGQDISNEKL